MEPRGREGWRAPLVRWAVPVSVALVVSLANVVALTAPAAASPSPHGYWEVASDGGVFSFGDAPFYGSLGGQPLAAPVVAIAPTPDGGGYWEVAANGEVFNFGDASRTTPSVPGTVAMTALGDRAYLAAGSDGSVVFQGGTLGTYSSGRNFPHNGPIVGMAVDAASTQGGYWLVGADGGIFSFGGAGFHGSMGGTSLNKPIVGIAATPDGGGYWLVASDGGIFSFGDAGFYGSMGGAPLNNPIVGIASTPDGRGYWEVASDGGIFSYGDAGFRGSRGGSPLTALITGMAAFP